MVILDFGSGNTCCNRFDYVRSMVEALCEVDTHRQCVIKWQLWEAGTEPQCVRLDHKVFQFAFEIAQESGFRTTASVFDKPSLDFLLGYDIPFVKLANRPYLRHLARYVPRGIPIVASYHWLDKHDLDPFYSSITWMRCISRYPAKAEDYNFTGMEEGFSDHTIGLDLWRKYHPVVWEKHYRLPDSTGPDAGPWAITPSELVEVLG